MTHPSPNRGARRKIPRERTYVRVLVHARRTNDIEASRRRAMMTVVALASTHMFRLFIL